MKQIFWAIFFLPISVWAQSDLKGIVADEQNVSLPGVSIWVEETSFGTVTDEEGKFVIKNLKEGVYHLRVSFVGFQTKRIEVSHKRGLEIRIKLQSEVTELQSVEVNSDREATEKQTSGFNVNQISAERFHDLNMDVNQILGTLSGVNIREKGGLGSGFELSLNGLSGNQVRYFIDGVPLEFYGSALGLNNFPSNLIKSLEIYKGVTPVSLTSDALGGAVNIQTPDMRDDFLDASYSLGSFNTHRASLFAQKNTKGGLHLRLMSFYNHSDNDYKMKKVPVTDEFGNILGTREARRFHDAYSSASINGQIGLVDKTFADEFSVGFTYAGNKNEIQHTDVSINRVYGGLTSENRTAIFTAKHRKSWKQFEWKTDANLGQVTETYYDTLQQRFNWEGESKPINTAEYYSDPSIVELKDNFFWARTALKYEINPNQSLSGQISINHLKRKGKDEINPRVSALFNPNFLNKNFAGLSYDFRSSNEKIKASVFSKFYNYEAEIHTDEYVGDELKVVETSSSISKVGYGLAFSYLLSSSLLVKASYEKAYRLPEAFEIMGNGLLILPNADLKPESSNNINLGLILNESLAGNNHLKSEWNAFYRPTQNKIWRVAQGVLSTYQNIQNTRVIGFETANSFNINNKYLFTLNLTYQSYTDQREFNQGIANRNYGERMPNAPYFFGDFGLQYNLPLEKSRLSFMWNTHYVHDFFLYAESNGSKANKRVIPTQFLNDFNVNYLFAEGKYSASFSVTNIFDKEAYDNWSLQRPGRAFNFKLRYYINQL